MAQKRYVGVLYGITLDEIDKAHGGLAILAPTNVVALDEFDTYIEEVSERVSASADR